MPTLANIVSLVQKCFLNPTPAPGCYNAWMPISAQCVGLRRTSLLHPPATASDWAGFSRLGAWMLLIPTSQCHPHNRQAQLPPPAAVPQRRLRQRSRPCITLFTIIITSSQRPRWLLHPSPRRLHCLQRSSRQTLRPSISTDGLLSVHAQNSSLVNILVQIQHQTGLVIDGLNHDQRSMGNMALEVFPLLCRPCLMAQDMTLSSSAAGIATLPPDSSCRRQVALPLQPHLHRQLQTDEAAPAEGDHAEPADPTTPPQAKSPQEIFNEMRRMHPQ